MEIFNENYTYKLKLIGYALHLKKDEYVKVNLYILSHGNIYNISYINTICDNFLICSTGYDEVEIFKSDFFGVSDDILELKRINVNKDELEENNILNASTIIQFFEKNTDIITTKYFSVDLNSKKLIIYPEQFEKVPSDVLLRKLIRV